MHIQVLTLSNRCIKLRLELSCGGVGVNYLANSCKCLVRNKPYCILSMNINCKLIHNSNWIIKRIFIIDPGVGVGGHSVGGGWGDIEWQAAVLEFIHWWHGHFTITLTIHYFLTYFCSLINQFYHPTSGAITAPTIYGIPLCKGEISSRILPHHLV